MVDPTAGRLVLAATPIGDPQDASLRLVHLLTTADLIAAEDTRRLRRLAAALGVEPRGRIVAHHEYNEVAGAAGLVDVIRTGGTVLLVTDAGTPGVADPGWRAASAVLEAGLPVTALPGPSAALTGLLLSGLPSDRFCFEGFLPRTGGKLASALAALATEPRTMIFFESPRRTAATLAAMAAAFGAERPAALCRELTKTYEQVLREPLGELARHAAETEVLGEVTIVVGGAVGGDVPVESLVGAVQELVADGARLKDAVAQVATAAGVSKRELYEATLRAR
ncbi:16S rRNA (cytidine(1402)-2'-O)-methyltransferase [Spongisporangium articulatum]|uniref:Ribosomal RNA small subunit methyltransferase I n=1 Tax=Spongisporangium articulatum TaxID=3362603 RepID=A0ABW8ARN4_9ACTN